MMYLSTKKILASVAALALLISIKTIVATPAYGIILPPPIKGIDIEKQLNITRQDLQSGKIQGAIEQLDIAYKMLKEFIKNENTTAKGGNITAMKAS